MSMVEPQMVKMRLNLPEMSWLKIRATRARLPVSMLLSAYSFF